MVKYRYCIRSFVIRLQRSVFVLSILAVISTTLGCYTKAELKESTFSNYSRLERNKALAYSPSFDMYFPAYKHSTTTEAREKALSRCKLWQPDSRHDCVIVNVNDQWITSNGVKPSPSSTSTSYSTAFYIVKRGDAGKQEVQEAYRSGERHKAMFWSDNGVYVAALGHGSTQDARVNGYQACLWAQGVNCKIVSLNGTPETTEVLAEIEGEKVKEVEAGRENIADAERGSERDEEAKVSPKQIPSDLVRRVQELLTQLGYSPGPSDGLAGSRTISAVKKFQRDFELEPTGQITQELGIVLALAVNTTDMESEVRKSSGTGVLVTFEGHVITNSHVVEGCKKLTSSREEEPVQLQLIAIDPENDLAILKGSFESPAAAVFSNEKNAELGEVVLAAGFPLRGVLSEDLRVTFGEVNSMSGIGADRKYLQISAPIQPGNSGGPLLDRSGRLIGVVTAKLSDEKIVNMYGNVPQNVNFAIKSSIAKSFLDIYEIDYREMDSEQPLENTELAVLARSFTVPIECY